jgi:hypothetical protein
MDKFCEYNTQGFYFCGKKPTKSSCGDDRELLYRLSDTHYDMNMKALRYQLRVTQKGYDDAVHKNQEPTKSEK